MFILSFLNPDRINYPEYYGHSVCLMIQSAMEVFQVAMSLVSNVCNFSHHRSNVPTSNLLIHQHDCYELYYMVSGDMHFIYDGTEYALAPHTMILVVPGALHGIQVLSEETYERYTFHFVPQIFPRERQDFMLRLLPNLNTVRSRTSPIPFFLEHCEKLPVLSVLQTILALPDRHSDPAVQRFFSSSLLESLLIQLYLAEAKKPSFQPPRPTAEDPPELAQILDYLRRHPNERITLARLSERFFISRSQLNNLFQRYYHTSVMDYVASQRLSYGRKLLQSGIPAAEAASYIGYGDYSTFYRAYQRHFGHPPAEDKGNPNEGSHTSGWASSILFADPEEPMKASGISDQAEFPDISFENNAYDPLE